MHTILASKSVYQLLCLLLLLRSNFWLRIPAHGWKMRCSQLCSYINYLARLSFLSALPTLTLFLQFWVVLSVFYVVFCLSQRLHTQSLCMLLYFYKSIKIINFSKSFALDWFFFYCIRSITVFLRVNAIHVFRSHTY